MKCPDCGCEVYIKKHGRGIVKRRGKVIDVKDIEFIQCKKCGKYLKMMKCVQRNAVKPPGAFTTPLKKSFLCIN